MKRLVVVLGFVLMMPCFVGGQETAAPAREQTANSPAEAPRVIHIGPGVTAPKIVYQPAPTFSKEARAAAKDLHEKHFDATVRVYCWVGTDGLVSHVRIAKLVGLGLEEKAAEAVKQYRFEPAMKDGKPVAVDLYVDVRFQTF